MDFQLFKNLYQKKKIQEYPNKVSSNPVVSVLVQTYQHSEYISSCLDNILNQETNFPYEVIIGEDDSSDNTRKICIKYAEKYPEKIRLFLHERKNKITIEGIPTGNFNAIYNYFSARGNFIAFCEGDDHWNDRNKLQKQVNFLINNPQFVFCYHRFTESVERGVSPHSLIQPKRNITANELKEVKVHPLLQTVCFRNRITIPREMVEVINVDTFLFSLLGKYGAGKYLSDIKPSTYRRHEQGVWSNRLVAMKFLAKIRTFGKLADYYQKSGEHQLSRHFKSKLQNSYKMLISKELKSGNFRSASKASVNLIRTFV